MVGCTFYAGLESLPRAGASWILQRFDYSIVPTVVILSNLTLPSGSELVPFHNAMLEHRHFQYFPPPHTHAFTCRAHAPGQGQDDACPNMLCSFALHPFFSHLQKHINMQENLITLKFLQFIVNLNHSYALVLKLLLITNYRTNVPTSNMLWQQLGTAAVLEPSVWVYVLFMDPAECSQLEL